MNVYNEGNITIGGVWAGWRWGWGGCAAAAAAGAEADRQLLSLRCDSFSVRNDSFSRIYDVVNIQLAFIIIVVPLFVLRGILRTFAQETEKKNVEKKIPKPVDQRGADRLFAAAHRVQPASPCHRLILATFSRIQNEVDACSSRSRLGSAAK